MTGPNAGALGFLLHKHPDRVQQFTSSVGQATVWYPESSDERSTAALLLEVDPIGMVRGRPGLGLADYVTDRPYAASSLLSVAIGRVFGTALAGRCDRYPELAAAGHPFEIGLPAVPVRAARGDRLRGARLASCLFEPLGWQVECAEAEPGPDDAWGPAPYLDLKLTGTLRLADALSHVYVLLPVLDDAKHYWVGPDEVDKLIRRGSGWLAGHPNRDLITRRYLGRHSYVRDALARLAALDDRPAESERAETEPPETAADPGPSGDRDARPAAKPRLRDQRRAPVLGVLHEIGAHRVIDLGCGEGFYLTALLADPQFTEVVGVDVAPRELDRAGKNLGLARMPERQRGKLTLRQSSVLYRDETLAGYDALLLVEVIEHIEPDRLESVAANIFAGARPQHVVLTTPNREYNVRYGDLGAGLRHRDHRFEWTRAEFVNWAGAVAAEYGYRVEHRPVGEVDTEFGAPTQLALFSLKETR